MAMVSMAVEGVDAEDEAIISHAAELQDRYLGGISRGGACLFT